MKTTRIILPLIAVLGLSLSGCKYELGVFDNDYTYSDSEKYTASKEFSFTNETVIEKVSISWVGDKISLSQSKDGSFSFVETSSFTEEDSKRLTHYYLDGTHLRIHFNASGKVEKLKNKQASVVIPSGLKELNLDLVMTNVTSSDRIDAENIDIDTVSGTVSIGLGNENCKLNFDSVSGSAAFTFSNKFTYGVEFDTVSGICYSTDISKETGEGIMFKLDTVSANVTFNLVADPE